jgi:uncharacterized cupin superfamily protein
MIIRKQDLHTERRTSDGWGTVETQRVGDPGGITQFGASVQTLMPDARASLRHWHEATDEMLYVLSGELTVIEGDGEHVLREGDAACWAAGVALAHTVCNRSNAPCSYFVVGTRANRDVTHYEEIGEVMHVESERWRMTDRAGTLLRTGDAGTSPWR